MVQKNLQKMLQKIFYFIVQISFLSIFFFWIEKSNVDIPFFFKPMSFQIAHDQQVFFANFSIL